MSVRIFRDFQDVPKSHRHVITIGNFDGVHLGHQFLLDQVVSRARETGVQSAAITFDPLPIEVLRPDMAPKLISSTDDRLSLIAAQGIDVVIPLTFDRNLASQPPEAFVQMLAEALQPVEIIVGADFAFGHKRAGNPDVLKQLGPRYGFTVTVVDRIGGAEKQISSSRIRDLLSTGEVEEASTLLSRPFSVRETVIMGNRRGRDFGFPTANLRPSSRLALPPDGIYAAMTSIDRTEPLLPSVVYVGTSPTFDDSIRLVEDHLLDFSDDIYGHELTVFFLRQVRGDARFTSVDDLISQMHVDKQAAHEILRSLPKPWPEKQVLSKLGIRSRDE